MDDVVVVGQIARDLVLVVDEVPGPGGTTPVRQVLGGEGANIAVGLAQPGALIGVVGDDDAGARAGADGISTGGVVSRPDRRSGLIVSVVADGRRYLEDLSDDLLLREDDLPMDLVERAAAVVLQPPEAARAASGRVVLDGVPERLRDELLACADVVRADHREAELLTGREITGADDALEAARELEGLELAVNDVGNAFVAALTFAFTRGDGPEAAARLAAEASAATVTHPVGRPNLTGC